MTPQFKLKHTALAMALAAIYPLQALAAPSAGVAQFTTGEVSLRRTDGKTDALVKGKDIESGQAIITGLDGRAQVKFSDGGVVSLQPGTEFKVANYVDKADPKEDRFLVDLLRGSMRAITGLIGKRNRENYRVTTTTATIGIRGSGFNAGYNPDGSLSVTTELDAIEVCNAGGCVGLTAGESVRVVNNTDTPKRTNVRPPIPTPEPPIEPIIINKAVVTDVKPVNTGTFTNFKSTATYHSQGNFGPSTISPVATGTSATIDTGKLTALSANGKDFTPTINAFAGSAGSTDAGDFIGWGSWTTGTRNPSTTNINDLHYIVGQPTLVMPTAGTLSYNLIGQTPVTGYDTSVQAAVASGTLTSATFSVNFGTAKLSMGVVTTLGGFAASNISVAGGQFSYSNGGPVFTVDGFFTGVNASRAGMVYTGTNGNIRYSGAAAFAAP